MTCNNIYKAKDRHFFHLLDSLNNKPMQRSWLFPVSMDITNRLECIKIYTDAIVQFKIRAKQKCSKKISFFAYYTSFDREFHDG